MGYINEKLRRARSAFGLSQQDLADKIGTTPVNISRWENGSNTPTLYFQRKLCEFFGKSPEELGFIAPNSSKPSEIDNIEFTIQEGDISIVEADVVVLKYAQSFYGADQTIANKLADRGVPLEKLRPPVGQSIYIQTKGAIAAHAALFIGVPQLSDFGYRQIREFSAQALNFLALERSNTSYIAMTVHGVGFGLDEVEATRAQFAGYMDAISSGNIPSTLKKITIVDILPDRVQRLRQALDSGLADASYATKIGTGIQWSYRLTAQWLRGSYSRSTSLRSTKPIATAGTKSEVKPHVFVAMPFSKDMDDVFYYGIQQPVHAAGFLCERVDQDRFIGDILDRIKKKIETAAVVIAELSGANPNVYLEVGYAWGKGRPTILLVKEGQEPKFDVRGQRYLKYERIKDLEESLKEELIELRDNGMI